MPVLVCDASILLQLARGALSQAIFTLPFRFAIPDALYQDSSLDLGELDCAALTRLGFRTESLNDQGLAQALTYQVARLSLRSTIASPSPWPSATAGSC